MNVDWGLRAGPPTPWALDTPSATVWMHYNLKIRWLIRGGRAPRGPALGVGRRQLGCRGFSPRQSLVLDVPHLRIQPWFNLGSYGDG